MVIHLTDIDRQELQVFQRNVEKRSEYVKVTTILMLDKGLSIAEISEYLGIDDSTVYRYINSYQSDGLTSYLRTDYQGYWGLLSSHQISQLRKELNTNLYLDSKQVASWIYTRWGITYTHQGVVDLLNRIGFTYKQTKCVPCEADSQRQEIFLEELDTLLEQTLDSESVVYFADGVHPTHNTRSTHAWIEKGTERLQPTLSGRDRVNINAVINAKDSTEVIIEECKSVNAQTTKALYQKIIDANPDKKNIYIISDNARYYRNKDLMKWIENTTIKPIFLPPYSPNLNLIERLWKFMRKKIINTKFYRTKEEFRQAILKFFKNIKQYNEELSSLMTLNFHVFYSQSIS
jgi:transposase